MVLLPLHLPCSLSVSFAGLGVIDFSHGLCDVEYDGVQSIKAWRRRRRMQHLFNCYESEIDQKDFYLRDGQVCFQESGHFRSVMKLYIKETVHRS